MNIINRKLTLNQDVSTRQIECIAGCKVTLNEFEAAALLNPWHGGFTLKCVLVGDDPGSPDPVIFTFPMVRRFRNILDILNADDLFKQTLSSEIINEDVNGTDEIRAVFTLVDESSGKSVVKRSNQVEIAL
jgi:hypothetical protein